MSRDVVFDEMSCWYGPANVTEDADAGNGNAAVNVEQQSQSLSGPGESSANGSNAWTGRLRSSVLLMAVQIVVHSYHVKGRRRWTLHLSLMSHVDTLILMESQVDQN